MTNQSALLERLGYHSEHPVTGKLELTNPDGPEAAALIRSMQERIERLEGELNTWRRAVTGAAPLRTVASRNTDIGEAPRATVRDRNAPDRKP